MGGGAWPFLVGGVICLVYSVNERDLAVVNGGVGGVKATCAFRPPLTRTIGV